MLSWILIALAIFLLFYVIHPFFMIGDIINMKLYILLPSAAKLIFSRVFSIFAGEKTKTDFHTITPTWEQGKNMSDIF